MDAKHTRGPYSVHPYSTPEETYVSGGENHRSFYYASLGIGAGEKLIAEVRMQREVVPGTCGFPSPETLEEMRANAALFIAAPDLLEALRQATYLIRDAEKDTNWCSGDPYGESAADEFERIIAKASGVG